jgi:hypothetical protein
MSSPTRFVRMARRWASKATMISANRSARKSAGHGQLSRPGALAAGLCKRGELGGLYADMVNSAMRNIEETFAGIDVAPSRQRPRRSGPRAGVHAGCRRQQRQRSNFTYLASTGMVQFHAIPRPGSTATDDLAWADSRDVLIAMTCRPYRTEVVEAVRSPANRA